MLIVDTGPDGDAALVDDVVERRIVVQSLPPPIGYDPSTIPQWTSPDAEAFGILCLHHTWLTLMEGSVMLRGEGFAGSWRAAP